MRPRTKKLDTMRLTCCHSSDRWYLSDLRRLESSTSSNVAASIVLRLSQILYIEIWVGFPLWNMYLCMLVVVLGLWAYLIVSILHSQNHLQENFYLRQKCTLTRLFQPFFISQQNLKPTHTSKFLQKWPQTDPIPVFLVSGASYEASFESVVTD